MSTSQWSLVIFTILVQASVGMVVVSETVRLTADGPSGRLLSWQTPVACVLAALGLIVSLTHLGSPGNSVMTVLNVGQSWLSREILATGIFFLSLVALTVRRAKAPDKASSGLGLLSVLLGLAAVAVMSNVYLLVVVPVWDTIATVLSFFGTVLLTGAVVGGLLYAIQSRRAGDRAVKPDPASIYSVAAVLGLALQFLGIPLGLAALSTAFNPSIIDQSMLASGGMGLLTLRIVLMLFGAVLFAWTMFRAISMVDKSLPVRLSACALACVLAGEVLGRVMFYGSFMRLGL